MWTGRQKCSLIESVLLHLPVPEIFIQQTVKSTEEVEYGIVDGQQRIRAIIQFIGAESTPGEVEFNKFVLDKLTAESKWYNMTFADLSDEDKKAFYGYKFAVRYLNDFTDAEIRDMFRRLNRFLTPLNSQELRNATFEGPFMKLSLHLAEDEYWSENKIVSPRMIRRMTDVEFVSEMLFGVLHGPQGGNSPVIDSYYAMYEDFDEEFPEQRKAEHLFGEAMECIKRLLPDIKGNRWSNRSDFYSLIVVLAQLLRAHELPSGKMAQLRAALLDFAGEVDRRLTDEHAKVDREVVEYVAAVQKGPNTKQRRGKRHEILASLIQAYLKPRSST